MYLEIVSPEEVLFSSEVDSVTVPGINGKFQILNNHAPIVSLLGKGVVSVSVHNQDLNYEDLNDKIVPHKEDAKVLTVIINSGTLEMKDNKVIILAD